MTYRFDGAEYRRLRKAKGITVEHAAIAAGRTVKSIYEIEAGHKQPTFPVVAALAAQVGCSLDVLVESC